MRGTGGLPLGRGRDALRIVVRSDLPGAISPPTRGLTTTHPHDHRPARVTRVLATPSALAARPAMCTFAGRGPETWRRNSRTAIREFYRWLADERADRIAAVLLSIAAAPPAASSSTAWPARTGPHRGRAAAAPGRRRARPILEDYLLSDGPAMQSARCRVLGGFLDTWTGATRGAAFLTPSA